VADQLVQSGDASGFDDYSDGELHDAYDYLSSQDPDKLTSDQQNMAVDLYNHLDPANDDEDWDETE